jgi:hypothetical protein
MGNDAVRDSSQFSNAGGAAVTDSTYTQQEPEDSASEFAFQQFKIDQTLAKVRTMVLVQVMGITGGAGTVAAPGTVNVKPLVKIVDGNNTTSSHGTIMNILVHRYGGGNGVVICDPVVGDIGWMAVADRDSSVVVKTKKEAQPGSARKFNLADGVYMGSILSAAPEQYITFTTDGVKVADKNGNTITTSATGMNLTDTNGNQIQMAAGHVNIVTPVLQVNGVPVTVP